MHREQDVVEMWVLNDRRPSKSELRSHDESRDASSDEEDHYREQVKEADPLMVCGRKPRPDACFPVEVVYLVVPVSCRSVR